MRSGSSLKGLPKEAASASASAYGKQSFLVSGRVFIALLNIDVSQVLIHQDFTI